MAEGPSRNTLQRLLNTRVVIWISKWKKGASAPLLQLFPLLLPPPLGGLTTWSPITGSFTQYRFTEHLLGRAGARSQGYRAEQGDRVPDLKEPTASEQVNNRQMKRLLKVIRAVVTVNQNDLTASDEVREYETAWVHWGPTQGQSPQGRKWRRARGQLQAEVSRAPLCWARLSVGAS